MSQYIGSGTGPTDPATARPVPGKVSKCDLRGPKFQNISWGGGMPPDETDILMSLSGGFSVWPKR